MAETNGAADGSSAEPATPSETGVPLVTVGPPGQTAPSSTPDAALMTPAERQTLERYHAQLREREVQAVAAAAQPGWRALPLSIRYPRGNGAMVTYTVTLNEADLLVLHRQAVAYDLECRSDVKARLAQSREFQCWRQAEGQVTSWAQRRQDQEQKLAAAVVDGADDLDRLAEQEVLCRAGRDVAERRLGQAVQQRDGCARTLGQKANELAQARQAEVQAQAQGHLRALPALTAEALNDLVLHEQINSMLGFGWVPVTVAQVLGELGVRVPAAVPVAAPPEALPAAGPLAAHPFDMARPVITIGNPRPPTQATGPIQGDKP
jgi:hypothetical protein